MACLLAVIGHGIWFFWLDITWAVPRDAVPSPPRWTLVTRPDTTPDHPLTQMLEVWSPAAFALPTPVGFSRPLLTEEIRLRPPLHSPSETAMLLERRRVQPPAESAVTLPEWEQLREQIEAHPLRLPSAPTPQPDAPVTPSPVPIVHRLDGAEHRDVEHMTMTEDTTLWGTTSWSAELVLHIDPWGTVNQALVHRRAAYEPANKRLIQDAHTWRWAPADQADIVRIRLVYEGAPPVTPREEAP